MRGRTLKTVSLIIDDAFVWERFLLPQTESRLARGKVLFIPVEAREFVILTEESTGTNLYHSPSFGSQFEFDAVEIDPSLLIDIRVKISTRMLTSNTIYGVYLVCQLPSKPRNGMNTFVDDDRDGWKEVEIGGFYVDDGDEGEVEMRVAETSCCRKSRIIIQGIELRPLTRVEQI